MIGCGTPPVVVNADAPLYSTSTATYTCNAGFKINSSNVIACLQSGWEDAPHCLTGKKVSPSLYDFCYELCEIIFIRWTFNYVFFVGTTTHECKTQKNNNYIHLSYIAYHLKFMNCFVNVYIQRCQTTKFRDHKIM